MTKKNSRKPRTVRFLSLLLAAVMLVTAQGFTALADTVSQNDAQNLSVLEEADSGEALGNDEPESGQTDALQGGVTYELTEEADENRAGASEENDSDSEAVMPEGTAVPEAPLHHCGEHDTDWSYIYFGSYPQSEVTDQTIIAAIDSALAAGNAAAGADKGADVWVNGIKYRRISKDDTNCEDYFDDVEHNGYRYFKWERIKWRVLDNDDDGTLFVMADSALDCKCYNDECVDITWENSTIREWLNDTFYQTAFSSAEQSTITPWKVVNEDNPEYGTEGGNDTIDKVYLLSIQEVMDERYGFCGLNLRVKCRRLQANEYAHASGAQRSTYVYEDDCQWWLRSSGDDNIHAASVGPSGRYNEYVYISGDFVNNYDDGVAPALHINLSSDRWLLTDDGTSGEGGGGGNQPQPAGTSLTASQVTSRTDAVPQGAYFTVTGSDPANPTVSFDGVSDENAAAVVIPKTITYSGVEYRVTTVSPTAFVSIKDNANFIVTDNRVESLTVEYKSSADAKKTKAKTSVPKSATYKGIRFKVTSVAAKAFQKNKKIKQVSIAGSVTTIGDSCFEGCTHLKSVTMGKGLVTIGKNAFKNCKKLTKIAIKSAKLKKVGKNALKGVHAKCRIKVPKKQLKKYQKLFQKKGRKILLQNL